MVKLSRDFEGFAKDAPMFEHDIAVGHAGEVIAYGAVQAGLPDALSRAFANLLRMREAIFEKFPEHFHRAQVWPVHDGVVI